MSTQTLDQVDTIEALDFDPELNCESSICKSGHPVATHLAESIKCGCSRLLCQPCTEWLLELLRWNPPGPGVCLSCKAILHGTPRECVRLVPLK